MTSNDLPRVRWKGSVVVLVVAAAALLVVTSAAPRFRDRAAQAFAILAGAVAIRLLVRAAVIATSRPGPFAFDRALRPPAPAATARASDAERIRFEVGAATHRAMELNHQFRRRLRALADDRLTAAHGLTLDRDPEAAHRLLGDEAWDLLRADRPPPEDRFGPGLPVEHVARIVTAVEELSR
jgi:hypothetical protein